MPPQLASVLCAAGVLFLLVRDVKQNPGVSHAVWIPLLWLLIIASRLPSEWLNGGTVVMSSGAGYVEGSPLDRNIFLLLIVAGTFVVLRRSASWGVLATKNVAITVFFFYTFLSILWSDFPLVAFKRWHKVFGHVILVLVILTERNPSAAFAAVLRRCAYVLIPYSVLYLKYYPELGRTFDGWTGAANNTGITTNKNALGNLCQITALYFVAMMFVKVDGKRLVAGLDRFVTFAFLFMIGWLLHMAQSSTATVSTVMGAGAIVGFRSALVRRYFSVVMVTSCLLVGWAFAFTDFKDTFLEGLGEDTTLTGRTDLWEDLAAVKINPWVGVGFESFWLGERLEPLWEKYWWRPNQAHNGFFEMYLNLGYVGLFLMLAMIIGGYRGARRQALAASDPRDGAAALSRGVGEFRVAFLLSLIAFNFTEATFKAVHPSFFLFFLTSLDYAHTAVSALVRDVPRAFSPRSDPGLARPVHPSIVAPLRPRPLLIPNRERAVRVTEHAG